MGILSTLRQDKAGNWGSLLDFLREARHRESSAIAALGNALTAPALEQRELAESTDAGPVLLELACDLRLPKTARLAATRCLLEVGVEDPYIGQLFTGAGDLVTDPRLGAHARKLVEGGLPSAAKQANEADRVSLEAGGFARSVQAAASAVGIDRVKELLKDAPPFHAGAVAGLFAIGASELPPTQKEQWQKLLEETVRKNRSAPAAAKRMGLAPPWPPNLPDAFAPLIKEAEEGAAGLVAKDAAANPEALKKNAPPPPGAVAAKSAVPPPPRLAEGKTLAPPIRRSPFRQPPSAKIEEPTRLPPKPMEEVKGRVAPGAQPPGSKAKVEKDETIGERTAPVAMPQRKREDVRYDPNGKRILRPDRWDDDNFEWQEPVLPQPVMPPPMKAAVAQGPFAPRMQSLFEDRPEAVERLCAAAEVQVALKGEDAVRAELSRELSRKKWLEKKASREQVERLLAMAANEGQPAPWRFAARTILDLLEARRELQPPA